MTNAEPQFVSTSHVTYVAGSVARRRRTDMSVVENFTQARRIAKNAYSQEIREHDINPSHTDSFTDGFYASRDWCWEVLKQFIPGDQHLEAAKILGVQPFDSKP